MDFLSPLEVLFKGIELIRIEIRSLELKKQYFKGYYGSNHFDIASLWYDLIHTDIAEAKLSSKENSEQGFKMFMSAHFFLWAYPKNSYIQSGTFDVCEQYGRGEDLWRWIAKIAAMEAVKIGWDPRFDQEDCEKFILSVDGTDCSVNEPKHPKFNKDRSWFSKKLNHAGVKYEIAVSIKHSKIVWINGPFKASKNDKRIFREDGLLDKMPIGKMAIADRSYKIDDWAEVVALPNPGIDSKELNNFKVRARCRGESLNGRLKKFSILDNTFTHPLEKHGIAMRAVCVIVQVQMDNGSKLFAV